MPGVYECHHKKLLRDLVRGMRAELRQAAGTRLAKLIDEIEDLVNYECLETADTHAFALVEANTTKATTLNDASYWLDVASDIALESGRDEKALCEWIFEDPRAFAHTYQNYLTPKQRKQLKGAHK